MIQNITFHDFNCAFRNKGRSEQFSYYGLKALYNYLIELEDSCDTVMELDVIALCCEYYEDDISEILDQYNLDTRSELEDNTCIIEIPESTTVIIQAF